MNTEGKNIKVDETEEAFYKIMIDAYEIKFSIRTWIFNKLLSHMLNKIQEESTIYYLMCKIREHRNRSV